MPTAVGLTQAVIVAFYLYLLIRGDKIKRALLYWIGVLAIVVAMLGQFFALGDSTRVVAAVFGIIGWTVAFVAAVGAAFGGDLPVKLAEPTSRPASNE